MIKISNLKNKKNLVVVLFIVLVIGFSSFFSIKAINSKDTNNKSKKLEVLNSQDDFTILNKINNSDFVVIDQLGKTKIAKVDFLGKVEEVLVSDKQIVSTNLSEDKTKIVYTYKQEKVSIGIYDIETKKDFVGSNSNWTKLQNIDTQVLAKLNKDNTKLAYVTPTSIKVIDLKTKEEVASADFQKFSNNSDVMYVPEAFFSTDDKSVSYVVQYFENGEIKRESKILNI